MKEKLDAIKENALSQIKATDSLEKLNDIRVAFLGKKGELTEVLKSMKEVAPEDRPKVGQIVNETRQAIEEVLDAAKKDLAAKKKAQDQINNESGKCESIARFSIFLKDGKSWDCLTISECSFTIENVEVP